MKAFIEKVIGKLHYVSDLVTGAEMTNGNRTKFIFHNGCQSIECRNNLLSVVKFFFLLLFLCCYLLFFFLWFPHVWCLSPCFLCLLAKASLYLWGQLLGFLTETNDLFARNGQKTDAIIYMPRLKQPKLHCSCFDFMLYSTGLISYTSWDFQEMSCS